MRTHKQRRDETQQQIMQAAINLSALHGYDKITRDQVAMTANVSPAIISYYFKTMPQFRRSIMGEAIKQQQLQIIAQGIVNRDPRALNLSDKIKTKAMLSITV